VSSVNNATGHILDLIEEQTRLIGNALHSLHSCISSFTNEDVVEKLKSITNLRDEVVKLRRDLYNYIARSALGLILKEDWIRLVLKIVQVADYLEGIAYRLLRLKEKNWTISEEIIKLIEDMILKVTYEYEAFRKALLAFKYSNVEQLINHCKLVEEYEKKVDIAYRETDLATLERLNEPAMYLVRVIADFLESIADTLGDASDDLMLIALGHFG